MKESEDLFDQYAAEYEEALSDAIAPSGEGREYFAEGRVAWLKHCLDVLEQPVNSLLDFGCGDGATTPLLLQTLNAQSAAGVDVSAKSLSKSHEGAMEASKFISSPLRNFNRRDNWIWPIATGFFITSCRAQRSEALSLVYGALREGGHFSFWENNPWSLATRYVMSRCAFDRDAIMLSPPGARALLKQGGFEILRTDFRFIFPRSLRALRKMEDWIYRAPLGTQYQILCRKTR